ncbi:transposon Ty3-I Gag-Pol polyprotein [Trichonephila inaurata madagascariensis]|uniref:RNA-directed DNA polymerase n=1 Tax=Trichonephila inaurata madagascariensis TaxID=2747483 RepID=A0A8X6MET8_9ARAC|nr:transposon Ty3-I Gag-Pol polyprotein [Trichonephila inaurata madagascariensis]
MATENTYILYESHGGKSQQETNDSVGSTEDIKQLIIADGPKEVKSNLAETSFNYINSVIGSGIVGIPYALQQAGLGMGIVLLLLIAVATDYSLCIMIKAGTAAGVTTYQLEGHNFIIFTDHRPLTFAFNKIWDSCSPRQLRHLDFISQFSTDIRHVSGSDNSVADALSRINALNLSTTDLQHLADSQTKDEELKTLISSYDLSIKLKPLKMGNALEIFCDVSREKVRPYVPEELRFEVFRSLHNLSHPGIRATKLLIQDRFVWPSMLKDIAKWTRCCIPCQRSKVQRLTVSPIQPFAPTVERFQHVHVDLVGPFPSSDGFTFLLTCIDRYTRWPEAIPVSGISAEAVAKSFIANWISRFSVYLPS